MARDPAVCSKSTAAGFALGSTLNVLSYAMPRCPYPPEEVCATIAPEVGLTARIANWR
jgi:hypothetical protein